MGVYVATGRQAFAYCNVGGVVDCTRDPAPDLNLLIAPLYSWLWNQTGQRRFSIAGTRYSTPA